MESNAMQWQAAGNVVRASPNQKNSKGIQVQEYGLESDSAE
jgi:hypothetical protein